MASICEKKAVALAATDTTDSSEPSETAASLWMCSVSASNSHAAQAASSAAVTPASSRSHSGTQYWEKRAV